MTAERSDATASRALHEVHQSATKEELGICQFSTSKKLEFLFLGSRAHDLFQFLTLPHLTSLEKMFGGRKDDKLPANFYFAKSNWSFFYPHPLRHLQRATSNSPNGVDRDQIEPPTVLLATGIDMPVWRKAEGGVEIVWGEQHGGKLLDLGSNAL